MLVDCSFPGEDGAPSLQVHLADMAVVHTDKVLQVYQQGGGRASEEDTLVVDFLTAGRSMASDFATMADPAFEADALITEHGCLRPVTT